MAVVHIIGAGMAGLACAAALARGGRKVVVYEAAPQAGGRCRSYFDPEIGRLIDNGNHLILGANTEIFAYLAEVGAPDGLVGNAPAAYPFVDLRSGERWVLRPGRSRVPWWIFSPRRRVPGSRWYHYLAALKLGVAPAGATVAARIRRTNPLAERLWEPLAVAVLNARPEEGAASLLWPVIVAAFGGGERGCRPYIARRGLGPDLVEPGVRFIEAHGGEVRIGWRLRRLAFSEGTLSVLLFDEGEMPLGKGDTAVLAVPSWRAADLVPGIPVPEGARCIVNAHFRLPAPAPMPGESHLLGIVGGTAQWLFARQDIASVTVSAAERLAEEPPAAIAGRLWADVAGALGIAAAPMPPWRIVKEKRATFAQTPANAARRPGPQTRWRNLLLAGDWTDTGLPATIEGAVLSGRRAAAMALRRP